MPDQPIEFNLKNEHWSTIDVNDRRRSGFEVAVFEYDENDWPKMRVCNVYNN